MCRGGSLSAPAYYFDLAAASAHVSCGCVDLRSVVSALKPDHNGRVTLGRGRVRSLWKQPKRTLHGRSFFINVAKLFCMVMSAYTCWLVVLPGDCPVGHSNCVLSRGDNAIAVQ